MKAKRAKELTDCKNLLEESLRWRKAQDLRNYIDMREKYAKENNLFDDEFSRWLEWAKQKADWYDPFVRSKDKLLNHFEELTPAIESAKNIFENDYHNKTKNWFQKSFYQKG